MDSSREEADKAMMMRCIELSLIAAGEGEYPFGTVIALDGKIVAEAINRTVHDGDVSRHAEILALSIALKAVGRHALSRATLYTNIEPCAMCSYCIREAWIGRVVYGLNSPVMGGVSRWNILRDSQISERIPIFGPAPEVVSGVLPAEVRQAWRSWNPVALELALLRGVLATPKPEEDQVNVLPAHGRSLVHRAIFAFTRLTARRARQAGEPPTL
jgi:tRNA(adenine34) deaminase